MKICYKCRNKFDDAQKRCGVCGFELYPYDENAVEEPERLGRFHYIAIAVCFCVFVIALLLVTVGPLKRDKQLTLGNYEKYIDVKTEIKVINWYLSGDAAIHKEEARLKIVKKTGAELQNVKVTYNLKAYKNADTFLNKTHTVLLSGLSEEYYYSEEFQYSGDKSDSLLAGASIYVEIAEISGDIIWRKG